jgi:hypothetical protein
VIIKYEHETLTQERVSIERQGKKRFKRKEREGELAESAKGGSS